jgi:hypothetical protein
MLMSFTPRFFSIFAPWTCRSCLQQAARVQPSSILQRGIRTRAIPYKPKARKRKRVLLATTGIVGAATAGAVAVSDEAKHYATAVQRTGRVVTTLALCVNEYVFLPFLDVCEILLNDMLATGSSSNTNTIMAIQKTSNPCSEHATSAAPNERSKQWREMGAYSSNLGSI